MRTLDQSTAGRSRERDLTASESTEPATPRAAIIADSSDDAIISYDLNGVIARWNNGAVRLFGYTAAESVGRQINILIPPDRLQEGPFIAECLHRGERIDLSFHHPPFST